MVFATVTTMVMLAAEAYGRWKLTAMSRGVERMLRRLGAVLVAVTTAVTLASSGAWAADHQAVDADTFRAWCAANAVDDTAATACLEGIDAILASGDRARQSRECDHLGVASLAIDDARVVVSELVGAVDLVAAGDLMSKVAGSFPDFTKSMEISAIEGAIDEAISLAESSGVTESIEELEAGAEEALGAVEIWAAENPEIICDSVALAAGGTAGIVVLYVTGSPGAALRAFDEATSVTAGGSRDAEE